MYPLYVCLYMYHGTVYGGHISRQPPMYYLFGIDVDINSAARAAEVQRSHRRCAWGGMPQSIAHSYGRGPSLTLRRGATT